MRKRLSDLTGRKFGWLTVIEKAYKDHAGWHYKCHCQCGDETIVRGSNLTQNHSTSCGCRNFRTFHYLRQITADKRRVFKCKEISV